MVDTIKKKLTIKSPRAQAQTEEGGDSTVMTDVLPPQASGAVVPINPLFAGDTVKAPSYTVYAILALLTCLMYTILLLVQWMELSYYAQPPSLWPIY